MLRGEEHLDIIHYKDVMTTCLSDSTCTTHSRMVLLLWDKKEVDCIITV